MYVRIVFDVVQVIVTPVESAVKVVPVTVVEGVEVEETSFIV